MRDLGGKARKWERRVERSEGRRRNLHSSPIRRAMDARLPDAGRQHRPDPPTRQGQKRDGGLGIGDSHK